jgi:hypothetical protein
VACSQCLNALCDDDDDDVYSAQGLPAQRALLHSIRFLINALEPIQALCDLPNGRSVNQRTTYYVSALGSSLPSMPQAINSAPYVVNKWLTDQHIA